jgi:cysteine desulfurase
MTVYLDHNATTPPHEEVVEAMLPYLRGSFGNASSDHGVGRAARAAVETARERIAALVGSDPDEILLCGSGTEACNLALRGATLARQRGDHLLVSSIEHHAVGDTTAALAAEGLRVSRLSVDEQGRVSASAVEHAMEDETFLVSVMHANNEVGTIQPIAEIGAQIARRDVVFHCDGVQSVGKIEVDVRELRVDLLSMSGHKIHGPQGVGALFVRRGTPLKGILFGGAQEEGLRPGTYNLPGIVGMGKAAQIAAKNLALDSAYVESLRDELEAGLARVAPDAVVLGAPARRLPGTALVAFPGQDNRLLAENLDLAGIAVSTGAACSAGVDEPSHVLAAMGLDPRLARGTIRFSLGSGNSQQDVTETLDALTSILGSRRRKGPLSRALNAVRSVREGVSR